MNVGKPDWRNEVHRPSIPVLFWGALLFWAACGVTFGALRLADTQACTALACGALCVSAIAALIALQGRVRAAAFALCLLALGVALASGKAASLHAYDGAEFAGPCQAVLFVDEDTRATARGAQADCTATLEGGAHLAVSATFPDGETHLRGERIVARLELSAIDYERDPWSWGAGSCARAEVRSHEPASGSHPLDALFALRNRAIAGVGGGDEAHALVQALACGYRGSVRDAPVYADFQSCGIAHLIAVSGAHLVIVTSLMASVLRAARAPKALSSALLVLTMVSYLVLSGVPVSALRATAMSALSVLSFLGKRRSSSLGALAVTIMFFVGANPHESLSVSFALSTLATAGIVVFAPIVGAWLEATVVGKAAFVREALSLTIASSVLAQPFACSMFSLLPLVSPLANLVCAPLFPLACTSSLAASLLVGLGVPASGFAVGLAAAVTGLLARVASLLAAIPFACIPFSLGTVPALAFSLALAFALWWFWSRRATTIAFGVCALLVASAIVAPGIVQPRDAIVLVDVGQGDSLLVRSAGQTLLIDTGNKDAKLKAYLADNRIARLDSILVTHADDDHCGSLDVVRACASCERILVAADMSTCRASACTEFMAEARSTAREVVGLDVGDRFYVGACAFEVVWPAAFADDGGNADSLCVRMEYDGDADGEADVTALFTGDAEHEQLEQMAQAGLIGDVDILKVGHHGSRNGMDAADVALLRPELALIGVGENNRYGHPAPEILELLDGAGCEVLRTDLDGTVVCELTPAGVQVRR